MWGKRVRNPLAEKDVQSQARLQGSWECVQIFMPDRELPEMRDPERKGKVFGVEREPKGEKAQPGSFLSPKSQLCRVPGRKMRPKGGQGLEPPPGR